MHSLTKSAIFFAVGHIAQVKGTQRIADISGLTVTHPIARLGPGRSASSAIAGLPPFGMFMSEFLIVSLDLRAAAAACRGAGARPAAGVRRAAAAAQASRSAQPRGAPIPSQASYVPMFAHLALVLVAGIWLPPPLVAVVPHVGEAAGMVAMAAQIRS